MTNPNHAHITMVIDRSGSMAQTRADAQGGIDSFIAEQKAQPGTCSLSIIDFATEIASPFGPADIQLFSGYTLRPAGSTALYDAIGRAITQTGNYLNALPEPERPAKVVIFIVTDGGENASREYMSATLATMISTQQSAYNWQFVFVGSDQAGVLAAKSIGINNTASYAPNSFGTRGVYGQTANAVSSYRGAAGGQSMPTIRDVDSEGNVVSPA